MNAKFFYRCRLCRETYADSGQVVSNKAALALSVAEIIEQKPANRNLIPPLVIVHACDRGAYGVADFIGATVDDE